RTSNSKTHEPRHRTTQEVHTELTAPKRPGNRSGGSLPLSSTKEGVKRMPEGTTTPSDVLGLAKKADAQLVDFRFCDLPGLIQHTGIADTSYWGPECEFYIFDSIRFDQNQHEGYYHINAVEGAWNTGAEEGGRNLGYKPRYKEGYFPLPPMDHHQDLRTEMVL